MGTIGLAGSGSLLVFVAFVLASVGGGIAAATVIHLLSLALREAIPSVLIMWVWGAAATAVLAFTESLPLRRARVRPFGPTRQVCAAGFRANPRRTALRWGFELGSGFFTRVNSWAFWTMVALMFLASSWWVALGAGGLFGLGRGVQPVFAATRGAGADLLVRRVAQLDSRIPLGGLCLSLGTVWVMMVR